MNTIPPPKKKIVFADLDVADARSAYLSKRRQNAWLRAQNWAQAHHTESGEWIIQKWLAEAFMAGFDFAEDN